MKTGVAVKKGKKHAGSDRLAMGRKRRDAFFPAPGGHSNLPQDYAGLLVDLKHRIQSARLRTVMAANSAMVLLYWDMGKMILKRQDREGWGARVIDRLAADLRQAFPDMQGLSPRNLKYMRAFAAAWPDRVIVQQTAAQLPWFHNCLILDKLNEPHIRQWYMRSAIANGWSRNMLALQISSHVHERQGKIAHNFVSTLPPADSDMAAQAFKDPYLFDFLGTADPRRERDIEQALVDHIQKFLLELGAGFAFVGRQVHLEVGTQDFYIDLLFYHLKLRCYVVIELKAVPFDPAFVGQLNFYLSAVDDLLRHPEDKPAIGLLLCSSNDKVIVEYALRDLKKPIGIAEWKTKLVHSLPENLKGSLPTVQEIEESLRKKITIPQGAQQLCAKTKNNVFARRNGGRRGISLKSPSGTKTT